MKDLVLKILEISCVWDPEAHQYAGWPTTIHWPSNKHESGTAVKTTLSECFYLQPVEKLCHAMVNCTLVTWPGMSSNFSTVQDMICCQEVSITFASLRYLIMLYANSHIGNESKIALATLHEPMICINIHYELSLNCRVSKTHCAPRHVCCFVRCSDILWITLTATNVHSKQSIRLFSVVVPCFPR
jgi:hypothetical protein